MNGEPSANTAGVTQLVESPAVGGIGREFEEVDNI